MLKDSTISDLERLPRRIAIVQICVWMPKDLVERIDAVRRGMPRSRYIRKVMVEHIRKILLDSNTQYNS